MPAYAIVGRGLNNVLGVSIENVNQGHKIIRFDCRHIRRQDHEALAVTLNRAYSSAQGCRHAFACIGHFQ
jgi:hypothetical protein